VGVGKQLLTPITAVLSIGEFGDAGVGDLLAEQIIKVLENP